MPNFRMGSQETRVLSLALFPIGHIFWCSFLPVSTSVSPYPQKHMLMENILRLLQGRQTMAFINPYLCLTPSGLIPTGIYDLCSLRILCTLVPLGTSVLSPSRFARSKGLIVPRAAQARVETFSPTARSFLARVVLCVLPLQTGLSGYTYVCRQILFIKCTLQSKRSPLFLIWTLSACGCIQPRWSCSGPDPDIRWE